MKSVQLVQILDAFSSASGIGQAAGSLGEAHRDVGALRAQHHGAGVHRPGSPPAAPAPAVVAGWRCAQGCRGARCRESSPSEQGKGVLPAGKARHGRLFKPSPRTPPAARSHLGLALSCVRRVRAGVGAGQDCTELAAELVEPLVFFLQTLVLSPHLQLPLLQLVSLHFQLDGWMPIELLQQPPPRRQRCKEFLLAAVGRRKRLPGGRHGCNW